MPSFAHRAREDLRPRSDGGGVRRPVGRPPSAPSIRKPRPGETSRSTLSRPTAVADSPVCRRGFSSFATSMRRGKQPVWGALRDQPGIDHPRRSPSGSSGLASSGFGRSEQAREGAALHTLTLRRLLPSIDQTHKSPGSRRVSAASRRRDHRSRSAPSEIAVRYPHRNRSPSARGRETVVAVVIRIGRRRDAAACFNAAILATP